MNTLETFLEFPAKTLLCREGDTNADLYIVIEGKLLVCNNKESQVTPIAYVGPNEYLGELSFFDSKPRSAHVITMTPTKLLSISQSRLKESSPQWLNLIALSMIEKIRRMDHLITTSGIRRKNVETIPPLSIVEQSELYKIIKGN